MKPTMSQFATELDCLRARDVWHTKQIEALQAELAACKKDALAMRKALINWRQKAFPGTDQTLVIEREFPAIAAMKGEQK